MGNKTKLLDNNIYNTIINYISNGNYIKTACLAAGVSDRSLENWKRRAENYTPDNGTPQDEIYFRFFQDLKRAREQSITTNVGLISEAAKKPQNWPAAAWLLERTRPEDYARREVLQVHESKVLTLIQNRFSDLKELPTNDVAQQTLSDVPKIDTIDKKLLSSGDSEGGGGGK